MSALVRSRSRWDDALAVDWPTDGVAFLNPPYSRCRAFIEQAAREASRGGTVVALVPSRTETRGWHTAVWDATRPRPRRGVEVRFHPGRLTFGGAPHPAPCRCFGP
jgi:DNA N-6-adenine-methyltransferase (Dam)